MFYVVLFCRHWMAVFGMFLNREDKRRFQQLYEMTESMLKFEGPVVHKLVG